MMKLFFAILGFGAIADVNITWVGGNGPTKANQVIAERGSAGKRILRGYGTATLDGSATTFNANYVDGTVALPYTPSAVHVAVSGGTQQAAAFIGANVSTFDTQKAVIKLSGAGTNANTLGFAITVIE